MPKFSVCLAHYISAYLPDVEIEAETPEQAAEFVKRLYAFERTRRFDQDPLELGGVKSCDVEPYDTEDAMVLDDSARIVHIEDEDGDAHFEGEPLEPPSERERIRDAAPELLAALKELTEWGKRTYEPARRQHAA